MFNALFTCILCLIRCKKTQKGESRRESPNPLIEKIGQIQLGILQKVDHPLFFFERQMVNPFFSICLYAFKSCFLTNSPRCHQQAVCRKSPSRRTSRLHTGKIQELNLKDDLYWWSVALDLTTKTLPILGTILYTVAAVYIVSVNIYGYIILLNLPFLSIWCHYTCTQYSIWKIHMFHQFSEISSAAPFPWPMSQWRWWPFFCGSWKHDQQAVTTAGVGCHGSFKLQEMKVSQWRSSKSCSFKDESE